MRGSVKGMACPSRKQVEVCQERLTNWIPHMSFCLEREGEGGDVARGAREGKWSPPPRSLNKLHDTAGLFLRLPDIDFGIPREMEGRGFPWKKKKKKEKSVQINNLKWHSEWRSASPFPATVSCSQTGSLYISIREFVSGETLWSRWLFFFFF